MRDIISVISGAQQQQRRVYVCLRCSYMRAALQNIATRTESANIYRKVQYQYRHTRSFISYRLHQLHCHAVPLLQICAQQNIIIATRAQAWPRCAKAARPRDEPAAPEPRSSTYNNTIIIIIIMPRYAKACHLRAVPS